MSKVTKATAQADRERQIRDLAPEDPLMAGAWAAALHAAVCNADMMHSFRSDTGSFWEPGITPIERMIDEATGVDFAFVIQFIRWFNLNVWGAEQDGRGISS
jgi:hypothetical protein